MGASIEIQRAVYQKLRNDATLVTLLAVDAVFGSPSVPAIYDVPPQSITPEDSSAFPYLVIGDDTATEFDTDEINGQETTITIHVFSRYQGRSQAKTIVDAIYQALHDTTLTIPGHDFVFCFWEFSEPIPEPEVMTQHYVTRFRIVVMEDT